MGSDNSKHFTSSLVGSSTNVNSFGKFRGNSKRIAKFPCFDDTEIEGAVMRSKYPGTSIRYSQPPQGSCSTIVRLNQPVSHENIEPRVIYWLSEITPNEDEETQSPTSSVLNDETCPGKVLPKNNIKTQHISGSVCMSGALKIQTPESEDGFEEPETCALSCKLGAKLSTLSSLSPLSLRNLRTMGTVTGCTRAKTNKAVESNACSRDEAKQGLDRENDSLCGNPIRNTQDQFFYFRKPRSRFRGKRSPMLNWNVQGWSQKDEIMGINNVAYDTPVVDDLQINPTFISLGRRRRQSKEVERYLDRSRSQTSIISELSKSSLEFSTAFESESSSDFCDTSLSS